MLFLIYQSLKDYIGTVSMIERFLLATDKKARGKERWFLIEVLTFFYQLIGGGYGGCLQSEFLAL